MLQFSYGMLRTNRIDLLLFDLFKMKEIIKIDSLLKLQKIIFDNFYDDFCIS